MIDLFLDDLRRCPAGFTVARNYGECVQLLAECEVGRLSLDFHLGEVRTGFDVAEWIVDHRRWPREIFLHSSDYAARERMYQLLTAHAPEDVIVHRGRMGE